MSIIEHLAQAFIGESQARNRYTMYSKIAKKEGYEQIAAVFAETADQEAEHAKWFFRMLKELRDKREDHSNCIGREPDVVVGAGVSTLIGNTTENLETAFFGEHHEYTALYPQIASAAKQENLPEVAARVKAIMKAEEHHAKRYQELKSQLEMGTIFKKPDQTDWICRKCGYAYTGNFAPEKCPSCDHPTGYFQVRAEKY